MLHNFTECFSVIMLNETENVCLVNCLVSTQIANYTKLTQHSLRDYFRKKRHACNFSEKRANKRAKRGKYWKIWAKMYKI